MKTLLIISGFTMMFSSCQQNSYSFRPNHTLNSNTSKSAPETETFSNSETSIDVENATASTSSENVPLKIKPVPLFPSSITSNIQFQQSEETKEAYLFKKTNLKANSPEKSGLGPNNNKFKRNSDPEPTKKSQFHAFMLAGFLGFVGLHYFYLGYPGLGIAKIGLTSLFILAVNVAPFFAALFVGLGFIVWMIVDGIRIRSNKLQPKKGPYGRMMT